MSLGTQISRLRRQFKLDQLRAGAREELAEHGVTLTKLKRDPKVTVAQAAELIAKDHLAEDPEHYVKTALVKRTAPVPPAKGLAPPRLKLLTRRGRLRVYLVNATLVRKMTKRNPNAPDFTMGTGDQVWEDVVGPWEVWISDELLARPNEMMATMLHEMTERRLMKRDGMSYDAAHARALALEDHYRQRGWRGLKAALAREPGQ